jgi:MYXO-CTERM domain-containing protein
MRRTSLVVIAALGLVIVAQAGAHAELTPKRVPAGGVSTFTLSVEGEKSAPTVKVAMRLPSGMANLKPADVSGWQVKLGGSVITWTGGRIAQGKTGEFPVTGQFPRTPGKTLKFPVVQTYGNGEVVRWIGAPSSTEPAPTIRLGAAVTPPPPLPPPAATTPTTPPAPVASNDDDDNGSAGWIIGAAILVGLIAAGAALLWRRRS